MKRLLSTMVVLLALAVVPQVRAQQLRYLVIDGTPAAPTIVQTDLTAADRPTIARTGVGAYTLTFRFDVRFFNGDVQRGGFNHDAAQMLFTSVFATNNLKILKVRTYAINPANPTTASPADGRLSILVVR